MPSLKQVIQAHRKLNSKDAIRNNLGDGYLLKRNRIFRNLRQCTKALGYKFSSKPFYHADIMPLGALPLIIKKKTIPYKDNVAPLKRLEKQGDQITMLREYPLIGGNYMFHESAHACAHHFIDQIVGIPKNLSKINQAKIFAFQSMIGEAFANTCEMIACMDNFNQMDIFMLQCNSHVIVNKPFGRLSERFTEEFKLALFAMVFISFIYSNFLFMKLGKKDFKRTYRLVKKLIFPEGYQPNPKEMERLADGFQWGLSQSLNFRYYGATFYFKLSGIKYAPETLLNFDFMLMFEKDPSYQEIFKTLCRVALSQTK